MSEAMKTVYICYSEEEGEIEGAFDENGKLLDMWSCNDASWRSYFEPFLRAVGVNIIVTDKFEDKLIAEAKRIWG